MTSTSPAPNIVEGEVRSADGTTIAYERSGSGPALIMVNAAGCYRGFGGQQSLAGVLAADFTVFNYDRRGRGESTDTLPFAIEREVDDLAALITEAGGSAFVYGFSSGALLALHAAAHGLAIPGLALLEPPFGTEDQPSATAELATALGELVTAGRRADAARLFQLSIGVPDEFIARGEPLATLAAIAHTLVYDCLIVDATSFDLAQSVNAPALVIDSTGSGGSLPASAAAAADALPNGVHRRLAGGWHGLPDEVLAAALTKFFSHHDIGRTK